MKILPITGHSNFKKSTTFKGYLVRDWHDNGSDLAAAKETGRRVERTMGSYHSEHDGPVKIYYTDPLEPITDRLKEEVDYIVHDEEPRFPNIDSEVSKLYFFPASLKDKKDYATNLERLKGYFYRLEMSDRKRVGEAENHLWNGIDIDNSREQSAYFQAHVRDAQYNQETIHNCQQIHNEARGLIDHKDNLYEKMLELEKLIKVKEEELPRTSNELANRKELDNILTKKVEHLETKKDLYQQINQNLSESEEINNKGFDFARKTANANDEFYIPKNIDWRNPKFIRKPAVTETYWDVSANLARVKPLEAEENNKITAKIESIQENIEIFKQKLENNQSVIKEIESYLKELPETIKKLTIELAEKTKAFEKAKADLIPHFDKLKNYFNSRGLRVIR